MKKTCAVVLAALLAMPAFAATKGDKTDAPKLTDDVTLSVNETSAKSTDDVVADANTVTEPLKLETKKSSNPDIKFPHGLQFGLGVSGTTGLNGFVGYNNKKFDSFWWKRLGVRFDFGTMSPIKDDLNKRINESIGDEGIEIDDHLSIEDITMDSKHYGVMVDFYPFGDTWFLGGLRLTGGYMFGKMDLDSKLHGKNIGGGIEFELGDKTYHYDGTEMYGTANLDWKLNGPYIGTGFDLGLFYGFKIYMDTGVIFTNKAAQFDLNVPIDNLKDEFNNVVGDTTNPAYATVMAAYQDAKAEALRDAQKELDKYKYYPLIKMGFMYRF